MKTNTDREKQLRKIDKILAIKSKPAQWRAIRDFVLDTNPLIAKEHEIFLIEIETVREMQRRADARSAGGTLKFSLSFPESIVSAIRQFDPNFLIYDKQDKTKYKRKDSTNREVKVLMKAFPEYVIPRNELKR